MPIPTDTYRNIKRLNWLFAVSAILLLAVTGWSIIQDYDRDWRTPQQHGKVWEAALVEEKIDRETTPEKKARLAELQKQIDEKQAQIEQHGERYQKLTQEIKALQSTKATVEFGLNKVKAVVTVGETQLQDAIAAGDKQRVDSLKASLAAPRQTVADESERLSQINDQIAERKKELDALTASVDQLKKEQTQLTGDVDLLKKKLNSLEPQSWRARLSQAIRRTPLLQFLNPAEKVQQVVLPDVLTDLGGFKKVESIDRCMTCHVNIANKDFTEEKVLAYLEEQVASSRHFKLPETRPASSAAAAATAASPGPAAMPEFWHVWARQLNPAVVAKGKSRITTVTNTIGKLLTVTVDGGRIESFTFDLATTDSALARRQDMVLTQAIRALAAYQKPEGDQPFVSENDPSITPRVRVEIAASADAKAIDTARNSGLRYIEDVSAALKEQLDERELRSLLDRYRHAMVDVVNAARGRQGYPPLDPSPVLLAHPQLKLYVDIDSKHPFEQVGCTSCHDGSGLETDFVLAAHVARPIWVDEKTGVPVLPEQLRPDRPIEQHHGPDLSSMLAAVYPEDAVVPAASALHLYVQGGEAAEGLHSPATQPGASEEEPAKAADSSHGRAIEIPDAAPDAAAPVPYLDPVTGRSSRAVSQMTYWRERYEPHAPRSFALVYHEWDRPMLPPKYLQANCVRCHTDVYDIRAEAPVINRGRMLFKDMGCVNCHQMDSIQPEAAPPAAGDPALIIANGQRKVGPDLRHVTSKLSPAMINTWIWAPKAFRPSTKMPHFFMLENSSSDEELRRTKQEARSITEYLVRTATPLPPLHTLPTGLTGSAEAGQKLFHSVGCLGCHTNLNDVTGTRKTPAGEKKITLAEKWITQDLVKSGRLARDLEEKLGKAPDSKTLSGEAQRLYDAMSYNERQLYVLENLGIEGEIEEAPKYPDGTAKPIFVHHGPELSGIGTKLTAARSSDEAMRWLFEWLKEPRHYSAYTVMPRLRLTDQEALDLATYLLEQKRTNDKPDDPWQAGLALADTPKLIEMTSMFLRSRFSAKTAVAKADDPTELTALAADALVTATIDKPAAEKIAASMTDDERRMVFLGKKLIAHYGCMSCHAINGAENLTSPCANLSDWGQKGIDKLDFGYLEHFKLENLPPTTKIPMVDGLSASASHLAHADLSGQAISEPIDVSWPHVEHSRTSWLTQKLKNTRVYDRGRVLLDPHPETNDLGKPYDKLKMPTFYLNDEQVDAIVTFVISNRDRLVSDSIHQKAVDEQAERIANGRRLVEKFHCVGCHQVEHNAPPVQQWYRSDELTTRAPPSLRGEGNKIQFSWLFNFLKDVHPLRPLPAIRMPSFPLEDEEATAIAAYFNAVSVKESHQLRKQLDPVVKYITAARAATTQPAASPEAMAAGNDWYSQREFLATAEMLKEWGLLNRQISPIQLDPNRNKPEELGHNYRSLLFKALFTQELYDAPYPFVDASIPQISEERFKQGEAFFHHLQCLSCHYLGDPNAPGAAKSPTAPNLGEAYVRLQRRWVRHWVQEPAIIQAGTAMPPFFTGLAVFDQRGQTQPRAQGVAEPQATEIEQQFGKTADEETALLLDFLYAAGARHYTSVQPPAKPSTPVPPVVKEREPAKGVAPTPPPTATKPLVPGNPAVNSPAKPAAPPAAPQKTTASPPPANPPAAKPPATPEPTPASPSAGSGAVSITGKVTFTGEPPEMPIIDMSAVKECDDQHADPVADPTVVVNDNKTLANVVVWVSAGLPEGAANKPPAGPAVLDQKGCMYDPHVLALMVGQDLVVRNDDPFLHNIHSLATINPVFNIGQPQDKTGRKVEPMKAAEVFRVKCDVHPWMSAYVHVFEHPFFDITRGQGSFKITSLPPGTYTLTAWHEKYGTQEKEVTIEPGKPAQVEFSFSDAGARRDPVPVDGEVRLASASGGCPQCQATTETKIVLNSLRAGDGRGGR